MSPGNTSSSPGLLTMALWHFGWLCNDASAASAASLLSDAFIFKVPSCKNRALRRDAKSVSDDHEEEKVARLRYLTLSLLVEWDVSVLAEELSKALVVKYDVISETLRAKLQATLHAAMWALRMLCYPECSERLLEVVCWVDQVMSLVSSLSLDDDTEFLKKPESSQHRSFLCGYRGVVQTLLPENTSDVLFTHRDFFPSVRDKCHPSSSTGGITRMFSSPARTNTRTHSLSSLLSKQGIGHGGFNRTSGDRISTTLRQNMQTEEKSGSDCQSDPQKDTDISVCRKSLCINYRFLDPSCSIRDKNVQLCNTGQHSWHSIQQALGCLPYQAAVSRLNMSLMRTLSTGSRSFNVDMFGTSPESVVLDTLLKCSKNANGTSQEMVSVLLRAAALKGSATSCARILQQIGNPARRASATKQETPNKSPGRKQPKAARSKQKGRKSEL